jgi:hypothetical protein
MMKGRRASATKSVLGGISGSGAKGAEELEADIEDFGPPEWRTVLNRRADLGERGDHTLDPAITFH